MSAEDEKGPLEPPAARPGSPEPPRLSRRTCRLERLERLALQQELLSLVTRALRLVDPLLQTRHVAARVQRLSAVEKHTVRKRRDGRHAKIGLIVRHRGDTESYAVTK